MGTLFLTNPSPAPCSSPSRPRVETGCLAILIRPGETGAFGLRFVASGDFYYGWAEVSMDADQIITVERWALETTANTAAEYSPAGSTAVPGLGGLAALAIGAAGVRSRRQRTVA